MSYALVALGLLFLAEKAWKHWLLVRFFRRPAPPLKTAPQCVSILQPILSGDPTLPACLEANLRLRPRWPVEFVWLVDADDAEGLAVCRALATRYPDRAVRLIESPSPPDGCSPKMVKLIAGVGQARGDVICVLDDDTMLPEDGLETCLPYLDLPGVGLAFGLPYYVSFGNFWSRLVAYFVNSHALLTYVPYVFLVEAFTINGMFFAFRRSVYEATGGFGGLERWLADDFAVARHFRTHGYRLAQTPLRHAISTHVPGPGAYFRLLQRWFVFPRETVLKALPLRDLAVVYGVVLLPTLAPLFWLAALGAAPSWPLAALAAAYGAYHYGLFAFANVAYLRRAAPWRWSWLVVVIQTFLPLQVLAAVLAPQRIRWRGHVLQVRPGGGFRFVRRRGT